METTAAVLLVACVIAFSLPDLSIAERHSSFSRVSVDVESLLAFKKSVTHDPSHVLHNWNNSLSHCNWIGISCSPRHPGRVVSLYLSGYSLVGTISPHIGNLSFLRYLNLSSTYFNGFIPPAIGDLRRLRVLFLASNSLAGILPPQLGRLQNLREFGALDNSLTGSIPSTLPNCSKLIQLSLQSNNLSGNIPKEIGSLTQLLFLNLQNNSLTGNIEDSIQNLTSLKVLALTINQLGGMLPSWIGKLSKLEGLYLGLNHLKGIIPETLSNATRLKEIELSNNSFEGTIPLSFGRLSALEEFGAANNHIESGITGGSYKPIPILEALSNCSKLHFLGIGNNKLSGTLPSVLPTHLEKLYLYQNQISGSIPPSIGNLSRLTILILRDNNLSGNVPPEIGGLHMATYIDLSYNHLSGQIGLYMTGWLNAEYIRLAFNNFSGSLPHSFGRNETEPSITISGREPSPMYNYFAFQLSNFSYNNFEGRISCQGFFKNLTHSSFLHNHRLCGKCMGLPDCVNTSAKHAYSHFYNARSFAIIAVVIGLFFMLPSCYLLFFKKIKQQRLNMEKPLNHQCRAISKEELMTATNYFSEANIIGTGSYGAVYSGVLQSGEMIAVKIFNIENHERSDASFIRECQTLGKVCHRNLTKIFTVCCEDNFRAIVLPLMTKGNLHDLLHERDMEGLLTPITLEMRMDIISGLANALSYLHHDCTPSIVHCDVKPKNVLLDNYMTVKLTDFGIAKIVGTNPDSTTLSLKGSIGYIAPEYGMGGDVNSKGDVYSFGVVILEVMTRKKPTDDMFSGSMSMLEWVSIALVEEEEDSNKEKLKSILGITNCSEEDLKRMEGVIKLGIVCCNENPLQRPTMREVESLLSMFVGSDAGWRRAMPNLDDIEASLHANQVQPPRESTFSSTF